MNTEDSDEDELDQEIHRNAEDAKALIAALAKDGITAVRPFTLDKYVLTDPVFEKDGRQPVFRFSVCDWVGGAMRAASHACLHSADEMPHTLAWFREKTIEVRLVETTTEMRNYFQSVEDRPPDEEFEAIWGADYNFGLTEECHRYEYRWNYIFYPYVPQDDVPF